MANANWIERFKEVAWVAEQSAIFTLMKRAPEKMTVEDLGRIDMSLIDPRRADDEE